MNNIDDLFILPKCATKTFADIFPNYTTFKDLYDATIFAGSIHEGEIIEGKTMPDNLQLLYYLLYAKYGNNNITNLDETQWVYKVFSTIYKYGPTWQKKIELQANLRGLTSSQLEQGAKAIYNKALNPETTPSTQSLTELTYINEQSTANQIKSPTESIKQLYVLLETDVTEEFLLEFKPLFKKFISPYTRLYESEE